ncbi:TPA: ead/Ea22-like family protein [Klebsiella pneumoniae]|uniref:ead/Ea22-like family protein n=1 Tax=Klebsiella pneumoniae TaxID=573 RepID=UPI00330A254E|nr:ead/Ea22-like family protein [Klebsiella pneumoniae]HDH0589744.1 ead/Ea22-like family protein [Klebsiella pneumoniae]HDH0615987.1 ead/Ea22-like family protein [Klebsiella pneumoniae]HDH0625839.1 ead/Ea22-like family protein [Klebsiella pneumoniae]HDH0686528.1 ead/Ea22-like family protein [Klebsiella pneumoniae]
MTTDITELAQSLKAAAIDAKELAIIARYSKGRAAAEKFYALANPNNVIALVEALENSESRLHEVAVACATAEQALEKAQRYIEELREWNAGLAQESFERQQLISELEPIRAAAEKLVRCKGRYHSEQNYRALAALFGVKTPDLPPLEHENVHYADAAEMEIAALRQRIAELESRTVTVKLASRRLPSDYVDGEFGNDDLAAIHNACRLECKVSVEKYLSAYGIVVKWEDD